MFVESIQCGYYQSKPSRNLCDPKLHIFAPNFFNFEIIFALRIFETFVASNVFTFTFCWAMTWRARVGNIRRPADWGKDVTALLPSTDNLWVWASNVSQWVYSNFLIRFPCEINTHFYTIFPTPKGKVPIKASPSINCRDRLIIMNDDLVAQPTVRSIKIGRASYSATLYEA